MQPIHWDTLEYQWRAYTTELMYTVVDGIPTTVQYTKTIPRPVIVEKFFESCSSIDVHDHYRQGSLAIERERVDTQRLYTRG